MANWIDVAANRSRTMVMVLIFVLISGSIAYLGVPKESAPDIKIPIIYVSLMLEGVSPEDAERLLVRPMEKKLKSVENVKHMESTASEGHASVVMTFEAGFNSDRALQDVRTQVDEAKAELPQDAEEPTVNEVNLSLFPVVNVILTGDVPERTLMQLARNVRDKIEGISNVLEAKLAGEREEVLEIIIDPLTLENYSINPAEVLNRVTANNQLVAAGELDTGTGRYSVKLPGLIETYQDLMQTTLLNDENTSVTLKDVAKVRRTFKDRTVYARVNGKNAIGIGVSKRSGTNIIDTVAEVRALVEREKAYWPSGIDVVYAQDNSSDIRDMLSDLENNVILAVLLVMIVVMIFMGLRASAMVAFAVPGAFLIGVLCITMLGMTMNIVVLFSLILSVGMLVDSAIVVSEFADKKIQQGVPVHRAYLLGAKRMAWPIIVSTLTTLVVFMPLLFWPGTVGQFMKYMPITLILTLTGSLLMALIFIPVIGGFFGNKTRDDITPNPHDNTDEVFDVGAPTTPLTQRYAEMLQAVLNRPKRFVTSIMLLVVAFFMLFGMFGAGVEFFPEVEPNNATLLVRARGNLSVEDMDKLTRAVESRVNMMTDEVDIFYTRSGKVDLRDAAEDVVGAIQLEFAHWQSRRSVDAILADMLERTKDIPGVIVEAQKQEEGPPTGKAVQLEFSSRFPEKITPAVQKFLAGMDEIGGFMNIEDDLPLPKIEWEFNVNREMAGRNNISVAEIGQMVRLVSNGIKVSEYRPNDADDELDIIARFPKESRNLSQLDRLRIQTPDGLVPMSNFVTREAKQSVGTIKRMDSKRVHNVKADLEPGILPDNKLKEITAWLAEAGIDPDVTIKFRGEDEEQKEASAFLGGAFLIALFMMCLILVTQFNNVFRMLVILSAVFLSTGGVFFALVITGKPFGVVMSGVGVIALAGIVVNNNIILIDTYNVFRERGLDVMEALIESAKQRVRPILLTAGTTVLGLLPMVMGMNINFVHRTLSFGAPSGQWWIQLSTAIAGGLAFATVLTLFFTPCLLMLWEGRKSKSRR